MGLAPLASVAVPLALIRAAPGIWLGRVQQWKLHMRADIPRAAE